MVLMQGGPQEHRNLHPLKTEFLLVKASEMTLNDDMQEHLLPHQSILDPVAPTTSSCGSYT